MRNLEQKLTELEGLIAVAVRHARRWSPPDADLSKQQIQLLHALCGKQRVTVTALAEELQLSASATTIALNRLEQAGFVKRSRDETDRRVVWLEPSDEAVNHMKEFRLFKQKLLMQMFGGLTEEETEQFIALVRKMISTLA
ncbi:transcriptional regulator [Paenibacillus tyrfis]|uniref:MarR family winged helix-turn-helix transcriptional regulator n=1 Tax=Paenibacillus tyrfis TaxID=1501230 RepID=UPI002491C933|nr:MarR family transcriptional regulator [Paenibacillus tyrfis]GLI05247.1 transcriptional regulator [Paenibacillus tyrfis]